MKLKKIQHFIKLFFCVVFIYLFIKFKNQNFFPLKFWNIASSKDSQTFIFNNLTFNIKHQKLFYNNNYNFSKIWYQIHVFDSNYNAIIPSDLTLYHDLHILCFINFNKTVNIYSLASIKEDKYFKCFEFLYYHEDFKIGIIIYKTSTFGIIQNNYFTYYIDKNKFNQIYEETDFFDCTQINKKYNYMISQINNNSKNITNNKLKKLFTSKPICSLKRNFIKKENKWYFVHLFTEYFCFCKGFECLKFLISRRCKYFFYLYLIDSNKNVYKKTDFLLMDFILKRYSSDDVYPIFEGLIKRKLNAHYMTEKEEIYEKYCHNKKKCNLIIYTKDIGYKINDVFLEKYLSLILKLRQVLSSEGVNINFINNLINHNLTLYFTLHHKVLKYRKKFKFKYNIKYIEENDISECLSKTNLAITDFSSIVFDIIYRRKPYIIYIPDAYDPYIKKNYLIRSYNIINNLINF